MLHKLIPFGSGSERSQFNYTSWYYKIDNTIYIFDAPITNMKYFVNKNIAKSILSKIEKAVIFITHMHEHAMGGLISLIKILKNEYNLDVKCFVPIPFWMNMVNYLESGGLSVADIGLDQGDYYHDNNLDVWPRRVQHAGENIVTFGYVLYIDTFINSEGDNWNVAYFPNASVFEDEAILYSYQQFNPNFNEKIIYYDMTADILDKEHCYKDKISKVIPKPMRQNIVPVNLKVPSEVQKYARMNFMTEPYELYKVF